MLFSSITFLFKFLPLVFLIYFIVPKKLINVKNAVLYVFSLIFYAWGEPKLILLMIASTVVAYITGIFADKNKENTKPFVPKIALGAALFWNLGQLLYFKYTNFFIGAVNDIAGANIALLDIVMPIGISFYSFQTLSYVIDVYRGNVKTQKNFLALATYVALFPQLIAGPIVRYSDIALQLEKREESFEKFAEGVKRFAVGMGKKVIIANGIGELFNTISAMPQENMTVLGSWIGILAFTFQIYFDFSGYSDMAIGLGKMFGFDFLENFNYPYISNSITEFWRRWHISLSTWFRDYVYIPLGGNRKGKARQCLNIMIVWFLTGFWHGANWNFMVWGVYFGVILLMEKLFLLKFFEKIPKVFSYIYSYLLIIIGWGIFAYEDTDKLILNFKNMFGISGVSFANKETWFMLGQYAVMFIAAAVLSTPLFKKIGMKMNNTHPNIYGCIYQPIITLALLIISVAYLAGNSFNPFLYFRF